MKPFGDRYSVSEAGEVWTHVQTRGPHYGNEIVVRKQPVRKLSLKTRPEGYVQVNVYGVWHYLHRVVWTAYNGEIPPGLQVRHLDGDKSNNSVENLAVGTQIDNENDKRRHGTLVYGEARPESILTVALVREARRLRSEEGLMYREIKDLLDTKATVKCIAAAVRGDTWKQVME